MKPHIDSTKFGSITLAGEVFEHDVLIHSNGEIVKRNKELFDLVEVATRRPTLCAADRASP